MRKALLRYNTMSTGDKDFWRVIFCDENNVERLYNDVKINCPSQTSRDLLPFGVKFHITIKYTTYNVWGDNIISFS